ncbi:MAG: hypothetical protein LBU40_06825 [Methanobrevibacter sp.]|jgi:hypothetical protein|nr:hypothetical protein [Methanobrevibacter sp.]
MINREFTITITPEQIDKISPELKKSIEEMKKFRKELKKEGTDDFIY